MEKLKLPLIEALPAKLVTPERFRGVLSAADLALGDTIAFEPVRLPEVARIYSEAA